jgi:hypothetical protein
VVTVDNLQWRRKPNFGYGCIRGNDFGPPFGAGAASVNLRPSDFTAAGADLVAALRADAARLHRLGLRPDMNFRLAIDSLVGKAAAIDPPRYASCGQSSVCVLLPKKAQAVGAAFFR